MSNIKTFTSFWKEASITPAVNIEGFSRIVICVDGHSLESFYGHYDDNLKLWIDEATYQPRAVIYWMWIPKFQYSE